VSPDEIEVAIQGAFDGTLREEDCLRLREVLKRDPAARVLYFEHAALHQLLVYRLSRSHPLDTARTLTDARLKLQNRRNVRASLAVAAAVVLLLGLALMRLLAPEPAALATMEVSAGSRFTVQAPDAGSGPSPADGLREGTRIRLDQGSLELRIRNGSRAVVLAPAHLRIDSESRMTLYEGTAWFEIGKDAKGFQVVTPQLMVTDLGTQFGVLALLDASHEIHVFSGKVIARSRSGLKTEEQLTSGMARLCDPAGRLKAVPLLPESFLSLLPAHPPSTLIANGGFEAGSPPPPSNYGPYATAAMLPGWRFGSDIVVMRATAEGHPGYGERSITILSSTADNQVGFNFGREGRPSVKTVSLWQTFATQPGRKYEVHFEMGAIFFEPTTLEITAAVHDGDAPEGPPDSPPLASQIARRASTDSNGYNLPVKFSFTASSGSSTLVFTETSEHSLSADPVIDNIFVKEVP
jgi:ferric-dicitrate binding protein FerR (iron transport regulator)